MLGGGSSIGEEEPLSETVVLGIVQCLVRQRDINLVFLD